MALADKWGVWGGLTIGCAVVGQEPILVALALAGRRHAPDLVAAGGQQRGLRGHLLRGRIVRLHQVANL